MAESYYDAAVRLQDLLPRELRELYRDDPIVHAVFMSHAQREGATREEALIDALVAQTATAKALLDGLVKAAALAPAPPIVVTTDEMHRHRPPLVHALFEGETLCGKPGPPGKWRDGDRWVSALGDELGSRALVSCPRCKSVAAFFTLNASSPPEASASRASGDPDR